MTRGVPSKKMSIDSLNAARLVRLIRHVVNMRTRTADSTGAEGGQGMKTD